MHSDPPEAEPDEGIPTGLPEESEEEAAPLGVTDSDPDGEGEPARGEEAMPGIPTEGEPPSSG